MKEELSICERYIYDPLYGRIHFENWVWKIITSPELQRLREVRLCNINSLCLTGGANINRYEHSIGTCYLAQECLKSWPPFNEIKEKEKKIFLLAALLHDIVTAPFGHSIEYIESKDGFEHEKSFEYVIFKEKSQEYNYSHTTLEQMFWGWPTVLFEKLKTEVMLSDEDIKNIGKVISGEAKLGPLMNGSIDLDNIDNVFRMAYHIGIFKLNNTPMELAKSLWVGSKGLTIWEDKTHLIEEWYEIRKKLYLYLLLNPEEFSGKCMLTEAIELGKIERTVPFSWHDTDYELLKKLSEISSDIKEIVSRLMVGDLYGCIGIYSSKNTDKYKMFIDTETRRNIEKSLSDLLRSEASMKMESFSEEAQKVIKSIKGISYNTESKTLKISDDVSEEALEYLIKKELEPYKQNIKSLFNEVKLKKSKFGIKSPLIAVHPIIDVNKTMRQIHIQTDKGNIIKIGQRSNQLLIGVFFKNKGLDINNLSDKLKKDTLKLIRLEIFTYLSRVLEDNILKEVQLYGESKNV